VRCVALVGGDLDFRRQRRPRRFLAPRNRRDRPQASEKADVTEILDAIPAFIRSVDYLDHQVRAAAETAMPQRSPAVRWRHGDRAIDGDHRHLEFRSPTAIIAIRARHRGRCRSGWSTFSSSTSLRCVAGLRRRDRRPSSSWISLIFSPLTVAAYSNAAAITAAVRYADRGRRTAQCGDESRRRSRLLPRPWSKASQPRRQDELRFSCDGPLYETIAVAFAPIQGPATAALCAAFHGRSRCNGQ